MDRGELVGLLRALEEAAVDQVLIGATAMGFHGVVRATEDVDMLVRAAPENIERLWLPVPARAAFSSFGAWRRRSGLDCPAIPRSRQPPAWIEATDLSGNR